MLIWRASLDWLWLQSGISVGVEVIIPLGPGEAPPFELVEQLNPLTVTLSATMPRPDEMDESIRWISGKSGRGRQLNRAIERSDQDWIWVVHADSRLDRRAVTCIQAFCRRAHWSSMGYGTLQFGRDGPWAVHLNQWGANLRSRILGQPYGDQGLCIHRRLWTQLGGFCERLDRGEDLDFVVRARQVDAHPQRLPFTITTSARRYRTDGWLKTTLNHQFRAWRLIQNAKRWHP